MLEFGFGFEYLQIIQIIVWLTGDAFASYEITGSHERFTSFHVPYMKAIRTLILSHNMINIQDTLQKCKLTMK